MGEKSSAHKPVHVVDVPDTVPEKGHQTKYETDYTKYQNIKCQWLFNE